MGREAGGGLYSGNPYRLASKVMGAQDQHHSATGGSIGADLRELLEQARAAAAQSYSPYSRFRVGAAIRLDNGAIVTGTNVENVSYGLTICAERAAVVQAVSRFGPGMRIVATAVANLNDEASPPCGACRQFMAEFMPPDAPVVFPLADGPHVAAICDLLPFACDLKLK